MLFQITYWVPGAEDASIPDIPESTHFPKTLENADRTHMAHLRYLNASDKWLEEVQNPWDDADFINKDLWDAKRVLNHRVKQNKVEVKVEWGDINKGRSWVDAYSLALQDPTENLRSTKAKHLLSQKPFNIITNYCVGETPSRLARAYKAKTTNHGGKKYKFGVRVPFGVK